MNSKILFLRGVLVALAFIQCQLFAQSKGTHEAKVLFLSSVGKQVVIQHQGKECVVEVVADREHKVSDFPEDYLELVVRSRAGKHLASRLFCSSYQTFRVDLVDLDGDGELEFVFELGQGRGTSARKETLSIERMVGPGFVNVVTTPMSDFYASGKRWFYTVEFRRSEARTVDLALTLHIDNNPPVARDGYDVPVEKTKTFKWRKPQHNVNQGQTLRNLEIGLGR